LGSWCEIEKGLKKSASNFYFIDAKNIAKFDVLKLLSRSLPLARLAPDLVEWSL
jgi:hypothetical protein